VYFTLAFEALLKLLAEQASIGQNHLRESVLLEREIQKWKDLFDIFPKGIMLLTDQGCLYQNHQLK